MRGSSIEAQAYVSRVPSPPPLTTVDFVRRLGSGAVVQSAVVGLYAWGVTVLPVLLAQASPLPARLTSLGPIIALPVAIVVEYRRPLLGRSLALWGFTGLSVATWLLAPSAVATKHLDPWRAYVGMFAWGAFALISAAPTLAQASLAVVDVRVDDRSKRKRASRVDSSLLMLGALSALVLQIQGWNTPLLERALLVRLLALATGLSLIGASARWASVHPQKLPSREVFFSLLAALPWCILLGLLVAAALLLPQGS